MTALPIHQFAPALCERMLNSLATGVLVAFFAWLVLRLSGRQNSSTRFAVWFSALVLTVLLPLIGLSNSVAVTNPPVTLAPWFALPTSWAVVLLVCWAAIATFGVAQLVVGLMRLQSLRSEAVRADIGSLDPMLRKTIGDFQSFRTVEVRVSEKQQVPAAIGFFKPIILLPAWALRELSTDQLNSILIHEFAHLRRWDDWTNLVQKVFRAIFFFHPAVWWVEKQLTLEREMACDDAVLSQTTDARAYAQCLVSVAEKSFVKRSLALAQAAVSRMRHTSLRVAKILAANRPGAIRVWKPALGLVAAFAVVCGVSQSRVPQLVAFRDSAPQVMAAASTPSSPVLQTADLKTEPPVVMVSKKRLTPKLESIGAKSSAPVPPPLAIEAKLSRTRNIAEDADAMTAQPSVPAPQTMLVVFQSQQYRAGQMQWTVFVWQVSVQKSAQTPLPARRT